MIHYEVRNLREKKHIITLYDTTIQLNLARPVIQNNVFELHYQSLHVLSLHISFSVQILILFDHECC